MLFLTLSDFERDCFMDNKIVLIDGHSILNRAFYGIPDLTNASGLHTNAVYGFLNILFKIIDEENPDYLTVAFDLREKTFRHKMFDAYKGTRKPMPQELHEQVPVIQDVLKAMNIQVVTKAGYEADDVLGTIAKTCEKEGMSVSVVSGDRDLLQLASSNIKIRIPKTKRTGTEIEDYFENDVKEKYQVTPSEFIEVKALMGDTADNIPGVPGIGEKTATKLIVEYHSLDKIYDSLDSIKAGKMKTSLIENKEQAYLSLDLARIITDAPIDFSIEAAKINDFYTEEARELFTKLEFKNLLKRFSNESRQPDVTAGYKIISDFTEAENVFGQALECSDTAMSFIGAGKALYGVSVCIDEKNIFYIKSGGFITESYLTSKCEELFEKCESISIMDIKSSLRFFSIIEREDILGKVNDIGLMAYVVNPLKSSYSYDEISKEYLNIFFESEKDIVGKNTIEQLCENNEEKAAYLACSAAFTAKQTVDILKQKLRETDSLELYNIIEKPLAVTLYHMECEGIIANKEALEEYSVKLGEQIDVLQAKIYEESGEQFNINSPKQLGEILFEKLKLPNGKKTKTGYSTSADVLEKLTDEHPIIPLILEYRTLSKLKSTYADGLANYIDPHDGRIHSTFQQHVTATGRISSTEPNLQNIPIRMEIGRLIRKVFVPKENYVFIDADYSQIELRVLAHLSEDEGLISAYNEGADIHSITASKVFGVPIEEVSALQRRNAKAVNFGIVYGISSFGLSKDLNISRKEATEYIEQYFKTYPDVKKYIDGLVEFAKQNGYVKTMYNRRRPIPELSSSNFMTRSFGERVAMNSPVQGTAADIIKIAMIAVDRKLRKENFKARLLLQVHDELLIETPEDEAEQVMQILEQEMVNAAKLKVKLEVDIHMGYDWYEAK